MGVKASLTVQPWGNNLAVRIPAALARASRLIAGQPVTIEVVDGNLVVRPEGRPKTSLAQKLKAFDPAVHGGEVMAAADRVGNEAV